MPGNVVLVADDQQKPAPRPPSPYRDGPLGSSGAAPNQPGGDTGKAGDGTAANAEADDARAKGGEATAGDAGTAGIHAEAARAEIDKAEASRAKSGKAEAGKAEHGKAEHGKAEGTKVEGGKVEGGKAEGGKAETGKAAGGKATPEAGKPGGDPTKPLKEGPKHAAPTGPALQPPTKPLSKALRRANPVQAARSTRAWARRPAGRLAIPAVVAVLLLAAAGTAGAYLVPAALDAAPAPTAISASATPSAPGSALGPSAFPPGAYPPSGAPTAGSATGARPAEALAGWAQQTGLRVGIPVVAVQAYGYAELVLQRTAPNCRLSWTTLAAIGQVESVHGSTNGAVLGVDGTVQPPIYGLQLDGKGGRPLIRDTDGGTIDGDTAFDRAVGPMQFFPQTWRENLVDADNNSVEDPNDIDDASLAAASYLCRNGRDLSKADSWWDAILSYNAVRPYAQKVFDEANDYGRRSRV